MQINGCVRLGAEKRCDDKWTEGVWGVIDMYTRLWW